MKDNIAVSIEKLSKSYKLYRSPLDRFKELVHPFKKKYHNKFWALNDITFDVPRGTTFAIVGQNGSGKSTLLQIISGIIRPTLGKVSVNGRISALLELGAGFHKEFTGRENVFMQGALMGIDRREMENHFESIANFADIGNFLDQPIKTYSSGMYVRLAFATAINVNPDILIIDEVLAVGDDMFKRRCYRKLEEFQEQGKTILFVSHNLPTVTSICNRAVLLDKGKLLQTGNPKDVAYTYSKLLASKEAEYIMRLRGSQSEISEEIDERLENNNSSEHIFGTGDAEIKEFQITNDKNQTINVLEVGEVYKFRVIVHFKKRVAIPDIGISIITITGLEVYGICPMVAKAPMGPVESDSTIMAEFEFTNNFNPGNYSVNVSVADFTPEQRIILNRHLDIQTFKVIGNAKSWGIVDMNAKIRVKQLINETTKKEYTHISNKE